MQVFSLMVAGDRELWRVLWKSHMVIKHAILFKAQKILVHVKHITHHHVIWQLQIQDQMQPFSNSAFGMQTQFSWTVLFLHLQEKAFQNLKWYESYILSIYSRPYVDCST